MSILILIFSVKLVAFHVKTNQKTVKKTMKCDNIHTVYFWHFYIF